MRRTCQTVLKLSALWPQVSLLATGAFQDNVVTHLLAGLGAGFFAVCVGSPVDVVKSRVMGELCEEGWLAQLLTQSKLVAFMARCLLGFLLLGMSAGDHKCTQRPVMHRLSTL